MKQNPLQQLAADPTRQSSQAPTSTTGTGALISLVIAAMISGLFAGFFLTYQMSVTRGLAIVDDETYVLAFQAINATIRNATFAVVFFGAVPTALMALVFNRRRGAVRLSLLTFGLLSALLTVGITFAGSIPLNDALAVIDTADADSVVQARIDFESSWNQLNLVRTAASILGFGAILGAFATRQTGPTTK